MTFAVSQFITCVRVIAHPRLLLWAVVVTLACAGVCQDFVANARVASPVALHRVESTIPLLVFPLIFSSALQALLNP